MLDTELRDLLKDEPNPIERLAGEQQQLKTHSGWFAEITQRSKRFLKTGERIVALECGHYVMSRSLYKAACRRCGEMIRSGYDHDGFRRLGQPDNFHWPDDPLRELNEGTRGDECSNILC